MNLPQPFFRFFELVQSSKTGEFVIITKIDYKVKKSLIGKLKGYSFVYNGKYEEEFLVRVLNAQESQEREVLASSGLLPQEEAEDQSN